MTDSTQTPDVPLLDPVQARLLGCLVEKEATTPDTYPLTVNAAQSAANQKTAREPVMNVDAGSVQHALRQLEALGLARQHFSSRADRYEHRLQAALDLTRQQTVLLALEDTENALVRLQRTRSEDAHLAQAAEQRQRAEQLAQRRYQLGSVGLYEVLDAQRDLYAAQDAAADSRARGLLAAVALYQALAGGWDGKLPPA